MMDSGLWLRGLGEPVPMCTEPTSLADFERRSAVMLAARRHPDLDDAESIEQAADHIRRLRAAVIEQSDDALDLLHSTLQTT